MNRPAKLNLKDQVGDLQISTVDLFRGHTGGDYETMIFRPPSWTDLYCERYPTKAKAKVGHRSVVDRVQRGELP